MLNSININTRTWGSWTYQDPSYILVSLWSHFVEFSGNKKVLLRERKRPTAHRLASTPFAVPSWVPPVLTWLAVVPHPWMEVSHPRVPLSKLGCRYPRMVPLSGPGQGGTPSWPGWGYPRVCPPLGTDWHLWKHYLPTFRWKCGR